MVSFIVNVKKVLSSNNIFLILIIENNYYYLLGVLVYKSNIFSLKLEVC